MSELHERSARVVIVNKDTHEVIMTINRGASRSHKMIGGGEEDGENPKDAAVREIKQETKHRCGAVTAKELWVLPRQEDEKSNADWFCWVVTQVIFEQIIGDGTGGDDAEKIYPVALENVAEELSYPYWKAWWTAKSPHGGLAAVENILNNQ